MLPEQDNIQKRNVLETRFFTSSVRKTALL